MTPMRVSATALDAFRHFMEPDQEWLSAEELDRQILGVSTPGDAAKIGSAFGRLIEKGPEQFLQYGGLYVVDGVSFDLSFDPMLARYDRRGLFEVKGTRLFGDVLIVAKADQLFGAQLIETKTTSSGFDFEKYAKAWQWRLMAAIWQPAVVTYRVAVIDDAGPYVSLREHVEFNVFPYAAMVDDCTRAVAEFRDYAVSRGLDHALRHKQAIAEAA